MFELRIQPAAIAHELQPVGAVTGRFTDFQSATVALADNEEHLARQLRANGEGASGIRLDQVVVEVSPEGEVGWLWSTYLPA